MLMVVSDMILLGIEVENGAVQTLDCWKAEVILLSFYPEKFLIILVLSIDK